RYYEQQIMGSKPIPKGVAQQTIATPAQQNYQKILNLVKQSLQVASQAVRQVQASNPSQTNLTATMEKLNYAIQQVNQLNTEGIQTGFTFGKEQQLKQLLNQIETALGTLAIIQQAIE